MSSKPSVSVIILNYNGKRFIKKCIDSVLNSLYPNFDIVLLDNASTDGSFSYLKKLYGKNKKVSLLRSDKQLYFAEGNNFATGKSKGEILIFLNSDTEVEKNWIKELVSFRNGHKKYLIQPKILSYQKEGVIDNVGGNYSFFGFGSGRGRGKKDTGQYNKNCPIGYANGTAFMIDKKFFTDLGGFDGDYELHYEDVDLNLRARRAGGESWYCHKSVIYHKGSLTIKENTAKYDLLFKIRKNRIKTLIKNFSGPKRALKLSGLLLIYAGIVLRDLLSFNSKGLSATIKATYKAFKNSPYSQKAF